MIEEIPLLAALRQLAGRLRRQPRMGDANDWAQVLADNFIPDNTHTLFPRRHLLHPDRRGTSRAGRVVLSAYQCREGQLADVRPLAIATLKHGLPAT